MMKINIFTAWESIFVATSGNNIIGFYTFLRTDFYPENRYSPWISSIYTDKTYRGKRISEKMKNTVIEYAKQQHFLKVYIPSDIIGLYEKYGFKKIGGLQNYNKDIDYIFVREI